MKKFLVVLLSLTMIFAFAACDQQSAPAEESAGNAGLKVIPLGGELGDLELEDSIFGEYALTELPEGVEIPEGVEARMYVAENCDTSVIIIYRWAKDGMTLEEQAAALVEEYETGDYQIFHWNTLDREAAYYTFGTYGADDKYYFVECDLVEDGDDFVEVDFYAASEELALGDSGMYIWVPVGGSDVLTEDEVAHGFILNREYPAEYCLPDIGVWKDDPSYEHLAWLWSVVYPEGLPFDKATYESWLEEATADGFTEEQIKTFYEYLGCPLTAFYGGELIEGVTFQSDHYICGDYYFVDIYFQFGDDHYDVTLRSADNDDYGKAMVDSLHRK